MVRQAKVITAAATNPRSRSKTAAMAAKTGAASPITKTLYLSPITRPMNVLPAIIRMVVIMTLVDLTTQDAPCHRRSAYRRRICCHLRVGHYNTGGGLLRGSCSEELCFNVTGLI